MKKTDKNEINKNEELYKEKIKNRTIRNLKILIFKIVIIVILAIAFFGFIFSMRRMETSYMKPSITTGDLLFFYRLDRKFEIGDIVCFKNNNKEYIMRIVAKPGQTVDISPEGKLLIDERPEVQETFYDTKKIEESSITFPYKVEAGKYFVLNDYRKNLDDSRHFGTISESSIMGKLIGRIQVRGF